MSEEEIKADSAKIAEKDIELRLDRATNNAVYEFWHAVAEEFPEAKFGDFPIDLTFMMNRQFREYIRTWVSINTDLLPREGTR